MSQKSLRFLPELRILHEWVKIRSDEQNCCNVRDRVFLIYNDDYGLRDIHGPRHVHDLLYVCDYDCVPRDAYAPHGVDDVRDDRVDAYDHGRAYVLLYAREIHDDYDVDGASDDASHDAHVYDRVHGDAYGLLYVHARDALCVRVRDDDDDFQFPYECDDDDVH